MLARLSLAILLCWGLVGLQASAKPKPAPKPPPDPPKIGYQGPPKETSALQSYDELKAIWSQTPKLDVSSLIGSWIEVRMSPSSACGFSSADHNLEESRALILKIEPVSDPKLGNILAVTAHDPARGTQGPYVVETYEPQIALYALSSATVGQLSQMAYGLYSCRNLSGDPNQLICAAKITPNRQYYINIDDNMQNCMNDDLGFFITLRRVP